MLPASGQPFADRTDGRIDWDGVSVGVFADIADSQMAKLAPRTYTNPGGETTEVYLPVQPLPTTPVLGNTPGLLTAGDIAFLHDPRVAPRPTLFEGVLYVSNNPDAYNTLLITTADADVTPTNEGCAIAEVQSGNNSIAVQMTGTPDGYYQAFVRILDQDPEQGHASGDGPACGDYASGIGDAETAVILARQGSSVSIRVAGAGAVSAKVDGEGPDFSAVTPEGRRAAYKGRITFDVHDRDSGLRHDGELVITRDGDYKPVNADGDNETFQEPLSIASRGPIRLNGKAADIDLQISRTGTEAAAAPDITDTGRWEMLGDRPGVAYFFSADADFLDAGRHLLGLKAVDRVGNATETGAIHDDAPPAVVEAWTGIAFDQEEGREIVDRSWIMLDFGEPVSDATGVRSAIAVTDNRVVQVVHSPAAEGSFETVTQLVSVQGSSSREGVDPRSRIYVRLARPLQADQTPEVVLAPDALQDAAGNTNDVQLITPSDGIAPTLTVRVMAVEEGVDPDSTEHGITGAPGDRPLMNGIMGTAAGRPLVNGKGSFVVDVMADEELAGRPEVYFTGIRADEQDGGLYAYAAGERMRRGGALFRHDEEPHWRRTYTTEEFKGFDGLVGLVIVGKDEHGNTSATPGWTPAQHQRAEPPTLGNALDLEGMDRARLLLEIDRAFNGGVTPKQDVTFRRQDDDETETDLFVRLDFAEEGREYERGGFRDSHATVSITEITLDGGDAMPLLIRLGSGAFEILAHNPGESHHDVEYKAVDDAGNERFFDVRVHPLGAPEPPYEVRLDPGWNLVSLPGTPERPALSDVVPSRGLVTPVLSYQEGDWRSAVLDGNGSWRGRLEEVVAGYGYWMFSIASETIAVLIPEQDRRETLPSVPVTHGWNLLGVMDLFHNPQGQPPGPKDGDGGEADAYFASIPWRIAYAFDTLHNRWVRLTPQNGRDDVSGLPEIVNGSGYWVWSAEPSALLP